MVHTLRIYVHYTLLFTFGARTHEFLNVKVNIFMFCFSKTSLRFGLVLLVGFGFIRMGTTPVSMCLCSSYCWPIQANCTFICQKTVEIVSIFSDKCSLVDEITFFPLFFQYTSLDLNLIATPMQYIKCSLQFLRSHEVTTQIYCIAIQATTRTYWELIQCEPYSAAFHCKCKKNEIAQFAEERYAHNTHIHWLKRIENRVGYIFRKTLSEQNLLIQQK